MQQFLSPAISATENLSGKAGVSYGYNDSNHEHAVTDLGGAQKYWYDANGNQVTQIVGSDTYNLTYDAENRLTNVTGTASATSVFVYDGDGNRVKSTINTTNPVTTAFIGNHTEWDVASSSLTRYYYAGSTRVAMRKNNTVYYLLSDHLGSTSLTTDQNGQNPVKQYYLPWGEVRYTDGTLQTKYTYTGQYSNVSVLL
jgi:YD repeat-containing protein